MQRLEFRAMGCQMLAIVDSDEELAVQALDTVPTWFAEWEAHLSRFLPESELNQLNRKPGHDVPVSSILLLVLERSLEAAQESGGLVTPTVLEALEAAGYDRSFESLNELEAPSGSPQIGDWRAIQHDTKKRTVRLPSGARLDFGGVAKGWAADTAARRLSEYGPALVDAGGDIAVSGPMVNGDRWLIAVADPMEPDRDLVLLWIRKGGVATSGRDYRRWQRNGKWQHHIVDPRTGRPAETDVLTATVIAPDTGAAEVAAKAILILGSRAGLAWLEAHAELAGLLVLEDGQVVRSRRLDDYILSESPASIENSAHPIWS